MPETVTPRQLLAWCEDPRCRGSAQHAVEGLVVVNEVTYRDLGAQRPGVERSHTYFRFANPEADAACRTCSKQQAIGDQVKPKLDPLSGFPQDGLLRVEQWSGSGRSAEVEAMVDKLAAKLDV